ncbi:Sulfate transporter 2.1 [Morella rubra]|nr:Sulfate transporter 2.1 [Morella rubra]
MSIRPGTETLGQIPGTDVFCDTNQYPMASKTPGVVIIRVKSALLCFANANIIKERIMAWINEEAAADTKGNAEMTVQLVILDTSSLMDIDTSGIASLLELHKNLSSHGIQLSIVNPRWQVIHKLRLVNFVSEIGGRVFLTVGEAVDAADLDAKKATIIRS